MLRVLSFAIALGLTTLTAPSTAQFPGDAFFVEPSIVVPEGGEGELRLAVFAGSDPLGAAHVELTWDPLLLDVIASPSEAEAFAQSTAIEVEDGRLVIVAANAVSLTEPTASSDVATVIVRPLGQPGDRALLQSRVLGALTTSASAFGSAQGFAAEVIVGTADGGAALGRQAEAAPLRVVRADDLNLTHRAAALRPEGVAVVMYVRNSDGTHSRVLVSPTSLEER